MNLKYILKQAAGILHTGISILDEQGNITESYGVSGEKQSPFPTAILQRQKKNYPEIICEKDGVYYGMLRGENGNTILIGPVCQTENFTFALLLIYHCLTGEEMSESELWMINEMDQIETESAKREVTKIVFSRQENENPHNPYEQELREMDSIRAGNPQLLKACWKEVYQGQVGILAKDDVRQAKNIAICVLALASREAIGGGLMPEQSFSMVDAYVIQIEEMTDPIKINRLMHQAELDFANEVAAIRRSGNKNPLVEKGKNYICRQLHGQIKIRELGKALGVDPDYLSALFKKEEGMNLQQYILREKIRRGENLLRYSDYSIGEIAEYLSFSSQSHFGNWFRKITGMTPKQYRDKYQISGFIIKSGDS